MKKYEFTGETKTVAGILLHRIRRLSDGLVGGWIEKEENLSHEDLCFVFGNARVSGNAEVYGNAWVSGNAPGLGFDAGLKFDMGKPPMALLPTLALTEVAKVLQFGAKKYAPSNWRKGMDWSRNVDAALRHIVRFNYGIDRDKESGCLHLAQAVIDLLFVLEYYLTGTGTDDRFKYDEKTLQKIKELLGEL
jgi:hypothetical protein